jgi:hypothetical protein
MIKISVRLNAQAGWPYPLQQDLYFDEMEIDCYQGGLNEFINERLTCLFCGRYLVTNLTLPVKRSTTTIKCQCCKSRLLVPLERQVGQYAPCTLTKR